MIPIFHVCGRELCEAFYKREGGLTALLFYDRMTFNLKR